LLFKSFLLVQCHGVLLAHCQLVYLFLLVLPFVPQNDSSDLFFLLLGQPAGQLDLFLLVLDVRSSVLLTHGLDVSTVHSLPLHSVPNPIFLFGLFELCEVNVYSCIFFFLLFFALFGILFLVLKSKLVGVLIHKVAH